MRNWPYTMGWVKIAVAVYRVVGAPTRLRITFFTELNPTPIGLNAIVKFHFPKIMLVSALQVYDLAKQTLSNHIEYGHHIAPVAYIFKHHYVGIALLCCTYHIPMIL